jgi:gamma-glutamyltranspeptidase/glutathione hydrolase/leukotriene-C4 hydrolase
VGSKIVNSKHCDFLEILSRHKASDDIFSGEIGEIITNDLIDAGSVITLDDLKSYKLKIYERELINLDENYSILVPDTSAILIPSIIKILSKYQFDATWYEDNDKVIVLHHRITEAFKHVFAMRSRLGDDDYVSVDEVTKYILSDEFADKIINLIDDEQVKDYVEDYGIDGNVSPETHGTSHISIVAKNGDAVSVTSSINF